MNYRFDCPNMTHHTPIEDMLEMNEIRVWDRFIRIFHWGLVVAFSIAYLSAEEENIWHIYSGYAVLGLLFMRLLWGIIGSKYARFTDFLYSPKTVSIYLKSLIERKPVHYVGHNPLAGWMVVALLLCLLVVTVSGLKVYAIEEGRGPLAQSNSEFSLVSNAYASKPHEGRHEEDEKHELNKAVKGQHEEDGAEEFWEEIHEASTYFMLFLIGLHIAGVIISSLLHKENLIKAMITGTKRGR